MTQIELSQFKDYCRKSPITVELLKANQTKYDYVNDSIFKLICRNPTLTIQVLQWLLFEYPDTIMDTNFRYNFHSIISHNLPREKFIIIIDHIIKIRGLYARTGISGMHVLHRIFMSRSFDAPMLNYLYQQDPQLDIWCGDLQNRSPLFIAIVYSRRLLELIQVIKSYEPAQTRTRIRTQYSVPYFSKQLRNVINKYAGNSDRSTICALIGICGELFSLIRPEYLTQDISDQFYSSKYFQCNSDQDPLIKLIPEQFQPNLRDVNLRGRKNKPAARDQIELV
jgi:hypothetical protein